MRLARDGMQVWAHDETTFVLRQARDRHFEAPFQWLLVGARRALLVDTGTGGVGLRACIDELIADRALELVVAHSHGHGDHVGGDPELCDRAHTELVGTSTHAAYAFFGLHGSMHAVFDLGDRAVDVIAIPGHDESHLAFYDRRTGILLTGDTLYPGRLYIRDLRGYRESIARLASFVRGDHPVTMVLGSHVELDVRGEELEDGATGTCEERACVLPVSALFALEALMARASEPLVRQAHRDFVLVPV